VSRPAAPGDHYFIAARPHQEFVQGRGGGPDTTRPFKSYKPLWQAHQICWLSLRY
jgi:hypothetical protein